MQDERQVPEYRARLTDDAIAALMGISLKEYISLNHKPIEADIDANGLIVGFHIHVSTNNDPGLLSKLKLDTHCFVRFKPEDVYKRYC